MSRFSKGPNNRLQKKATVIEELKQLIDKFKGLNCFEWFEAIVVFIRSIDESNCQQK